MGRWRKAVADLQAQLRAREGALQEMQAQGLLLRQELDTQRTAALKEADRTVQEAGTRRLVDDG